MDLRQRKPFRERPGVLDLIPAVNKGLLWDATVSFMSQETRAARRNSDFIISLLIQG